MDYEKKYNDALRRAKAAIDVAADRDLVKGVAGTIFPELRESEDERIRKALVWHLRAGEDFVSNGVTKEECIAYLEKQKEQNHDGKKWIFEDEYQKDLDRLYNEGKDEVLNNPAKYGLQKEQKPISTEDMPYVTDEHFFERTPVDSFKYKLAEYMTKNCKKGEGPYGYSYNISSESILEMAKEELIKRGELKEPKPAWSEEDERMRNQLIYDINYHKKNDLISAKQNKATKALYNGIEKCYNEKIAWLKSLRTRLNAK